MAYRTQKPKLVVVGKSATLTLLEQIMQQRERTSPELAAKQRRLLAILAARKTS